MKRNKNLGKKYFLPKKRKRILRKIDNAKNITLVIAGNLNITARGDVCVCGINQ